MKHADLTKVEVHPLFYLVAHSGMGPEVEQFAQYVDWKELFLIQLMVY